MSANDQSGFRVRLEGASLLDLVQMECLSGATRAVRVTSSGRQGALFFRGGQLVHAEAGAERGETAAFTILGWTEGAIHPTDRVVPTESSIATPWQALLLEVARRRDEDAREPHERETKLVPFPERPGAPAARKTPVKDDPPKEARAAVRLSPDGQVRATRGDAEALVAMAAYAARLGEVVGELLGADGFRALECTYKRGGGCFVFRDARGDLMAVEPAEGVDLSAIRRRLGL